MPLTGWTRHASTTQVGAQSSPDRPQPQPVAPAGGSLLDPGCEVQTGGAAEGVGAQLALGRLELTPRQVEDAGVDPRVRPGLVAVEPGVLADPDAGRQRPVVTGDDLDRDSRAPDRGGGAHALATTSAAETIRRTTGALYPSPGRAGADAVSRIHCPRRTLDRAVRSYARRGPVRFPPAIIQLRRAQLILMLAVLVPTILMTALGVILLAVGSSSILIFMGVLVLAFCATAVTGYILVSIFVGKGATLARVQNDFFSSVSHEAAHAAHLDPPVARAPGRRQVDRGGAPAGRGAPGARGRAPRQLAGPDPRPVADPVGPPRLHDGARCR
jgi:hypothetical protein